MTFPYNQNLYGVGIGSSNGTGAIYPHVDVREPTASDVQWPIGQRWIDTVGQGEWVLVAQSSVGGVLQSVWSQGGNPEATTSEFGIVQLATLSELQNGNAPAGAYVPTSNDVATVIAGVVVGAVPPATETQAGIAEIATQVETDAGADDTRIVTPLKLTTFIGSSGVPGSFTDLTATGTISFTGATGTGFAITAAAASNVDVSGAGIDLTLASAAGRVVVNGEEAAADAVRILSAAGGLDANVALQMNLDSSQAAATAVRIVASNAGGGIDIDAGTTGIAIDSTGAISIDAAGISNFTVTGAFDNTFASTAGSINISGGEAAADAVNIDAAAGGLDVDVALQMNLDSSQAANNAVRINASAGTGGIDIDAGSGGIAVDTTGAFSIDGAAASNVTVTGAGIDLTLSSVLGSVLVRSTEDAALAIRLHANGGVSETIQIHSDLGTGVGSVNLLSDVGGLTLRATGLASADAINLEAVLGGIDADAALQINVTSSQAAVDAIRLLASDAAGGIDMDTGTGGATLDSTGAISLDAAAASNFSVTGAGIDLTLSSASGSVPISAGEAVANAIGLQAAAGGIDVDGALQINITSSQAAATAIRMQASDAAGGFDIDSGTGGIIVDTTGAVSLDSALASNFTVTGAADLTLQSTAGAVNVISGEANLDSINVTSAGGMNIVATGAAAKDIIVTCTSGSMTLTAGENVTDAFNLTASGVASRMNLTAGTGSVRLLSGLVVPVSSKVFADSPYTVLGTDYFISVDTSGGAITITLPNAATLAGRTYVIRDTGGAAAASNITIATAGGNLVGGGASAATKTISAAYAGATVYSNGVTWNYAYVA